MQRKKIDEGCIVVSSDAIRKELYGSEDDQNHNGEVFNEMFYRTKIDRKSTRLNSSHSAKSRMPSSA